MSKLMEWIQKRPKLAGQVRGKNIPTGKTPPPLDKDADIATTASVGNPLITGPARTVRGLLAQIFPPYDVKIVQSFLTRFQGQGLGILDRIQKWKSPKVLKKKGISKKLSSESALSVDW